MKHLVNKRILIISPEPWDHIALSKHHYARTLASLNNDVYFLNPPSALYRCSATDNNRLFVVDYRTIRGINRMPRFVRDRINRKMVKRVKKLCGGGFHVVWSFDAFRFQNLILWQAPIKIYHVVDVHIAPLEDELFSTADLILSVSEMIRNRVYSKSKIENIGHGLAPYFLASRRSVDGVTSGNLKVGYVGNLDNWCIDAKTLLQIVFENPSTMFYFIGPYKKDSPLAGSLSRFSNTVLIGRVKSEELPGWFEQMDLFLMCYNGADTAVNSNHHKVLEFLSTGKPAVMNYTDEYREKRHMIVMSNHNSELPSIFQDVINDLPRHQAPDLVDARVRYAAENSYTRKVQRVDSLIEDLTHD